MPDCFKAYDIRGRYPDELDEPLAEKIGRAFVEFLRPKTVVIGRDARLSSPSLSEALIEGILSSGVDVIDIGLCGTEQVYFATGYLRADGGVMVTASHNPKGYNGMKLLRAHAVPISGDTGLKEIERLVDRGVFSKVSSRGKLSQTDIVADYVDHLLGYIDIKQLQPLKIVTNAGNGCAGLVIEALQPFLPFEFVRLNHIPDGNFPTGVPNPMLAENRSQTIEAVLSSKADMAIAWDGDFDRCFFFDERGRFIEGYYIVGLLAEQMLKRHPNSKILIDPRLRWNSLEIILNNGGIPIVSKTGHAFIKERMRAEDAVYGGEMSAHHYFRDFYYCDSGMIPWLLIAELLSKTGKGLSELVDQRLSLYPCSGEINRTVTDTSKVLKLIQERFQTEAISIDFIDGLSMEFKHWRFNLRASNTEPLLRLNVETRADTTLLKEKTDLLLKLIDSI